MKLSFLYGADLPTLSRLLIQQKFRIQLQGLPILLLHLVMACINTILSLPERLRSYKKDPVRPVFILGHWRSGTTHLHNLMTVDGNYSAPTTFQAAFPHIFMNFERLLGPFFDRMGPGERIMDAVKMTMESVQEEEIGLASLGAPSSYLAIHFPLDHARYQTHVSFRNASPKDLSHWKKSYKKYLRKIVAKNGDDRPLILKSPANTARIPLLLEMYPDARFIHIHRNPYQTIRSTIHLHDSWFTMANFQSLAPLKAARDQNILDMYEEMHKCWMEDKALISDENLLMLPFEELKQNTIPTVEAIYDFLGDGKLDINALQSYLSSIHSYKQNTYDPLSAKMIQSINERMGFVFEAFGYEQEKSIKPLR